MGLPHTWAYLNLLHLFAWEASILMTHESAYKGLKDCVQICGDDLIASFID